MLRRIYQLPTEFPRSVLLGVLLMTMLAAIMMTNLRWETDARVYFPPGHPAIMYDELVADTFHVKDSIIIAIVNEDGIFNSETLARVARLTDKLAMLPGVLVQRRVDVASLASATVFLGDEDTLMNVPLLETHEPGEDDIERLKELVFDNADLFVGNLVSADGKATMIRVKLKEGIEHRYQSYFQVRAMLMEELYGNASEQWDDVQGERRLSDRDGGWGGGQEWGDGEWSGGWGDGWQQDLISQVASNGDRFFMAGRPVIEVTSGQHALADLAIMIPLLILTICAVLFLLFRNLRGVVLPLGVVVVAGIWTAGAMAAVGIPMYTISTMLPVIIIAVGIADALHVLSHYQDEVIEDAQRDPRGLVQQVMDELAVPLLITTLTTAVGFLSLWWAEMPPFKVFGVFTALGIVFCWLASVTLVPAALALMQPHVSGYLARRRSMRVHNESGALARALVGTATGLMANRTVATVMLVALVAAIGIGGQKLYVNSSWIGDFKDDSEVTISNNLLNEKFDGTIFLNVVVDGIQTDSLKSPALLKRIEDMIAYVEDMEHVGGSVSLIDFIRSTNKSLHAGDPAYNVLPESRREIGEYLFLLSVSGRPELLDEVVNYDYSQANITFAINTDHTQALKGIINATRAYADREFSEFDVLINFAGSANNSYVWADLLINSQVLAIVLSKFGILLMAMLLFRSLAAGVVTVIPITVTTIIVAGVAGWLGIPMDVSTVLAAGVAIGVGVDYTVHYISRYALERQHGKDEREAVLGAMRSVGKPIVFNATVVTAGFLILALSQFPPHIKLGYFVSSYMVVACAVALIVLPLMFSYFRPRFERVINLREHQEQP
jgi:uncharacterized protein